MKIFISWSGEPSHDVAGALKEWLPNVFQAIDIKDIFLSSSDVALGRDWFHTLGEKLEESHFGVLCLTPENVRAPWILYEAGAIAKQLDNARVAPLLIGLEAEHVPSPLSNLQGTSLNRRGVEKLVASINEQLVDKKLSKDKLSNAVKAWWPELEPVIQKAVAKATRAGTVSYTYDVFLSAPMAAYADDASYVASRAEIEKVFRALKNDCGLRVFWAAERIQHMSDFDTMDVSVLDDLKALQESRTFVLIYPERLPSSALFEAGYALALKQPCHYFVREHRDLPFLMSELPGSVPSVRIHTRQDWKDFDDLAHKLKRNKDAWFQVP